MNLRFAISGWAQRAIVHQQRNATGNPRLGVHNHEEKFRGSAGPSYGMYPITVDG